jgi:hypothetical protein
VLQVTCGALVSKRDFEMVLGFHFGNLADDDLRAKLFMSHHHLNEGKKESKQEKAIPINLTFGDATHAHVVHKNASLRDVQQDVCRMFHQRFPAKKAILVDAMGRTFDEFIQKPFHRCKEGDNIIVRFNDTDDPYFYDWFDRKGSKLKLEEEIALEKIPPLVL